MTDRVRNVEIGPRDGLQNETQPLSTAIKLELIDRLADAGLREIEATAFVSKTWVQQMADHSELVQRLVRRPGVIYPVLVPNLQGFEGAVDTGADHVAVFAAASEAFSQKNINCSIEASIARFAPLMRKADELGVKGRGYVSCAVGCPYERDIAPARWRMSRRDSTAWDAPESVTSPRQACTLRVTPNSEEGPWFGEFGHAPNPSQASRLRPYPDGRPDAGRAYAEDALARAGRGRWGAARA